VNGSGSMVCFNISGAEPSVSVYLSTTHAANNFLLLISRKSSTIWK
jgi:hypothetical protein